MNSAITTTRGKHLVKHQFQPGISGNPNGRPRGSNNFLTLLRKCYPDGIRSDDNQYDIQEALIRKTTDMALAGNARMMEMILSYTFGKSSDAFEQYIQINEVQGNTDRVVLDATNPIIMNAIQTVQNELMKYS